MLSPDALLAELAAAGFPQWCAVLQNADQRLLPGMFANVAVLAGEAQPVVTVPRTAVSYSLYGDSVYVVVDELPTPEEAEGDGEPVQD